MQMSGRAPTDELLGCLNPYGSAQTELFIALRSWLLSHCEDANELIYDSFKEPLTWTPPVCQVNSIDE